MTDFRRAHPFPASATFVWMLTLIGIAPSFAQAQAPVAVLVMPSGIDDRDDAWRRALADDLADRERAAIDDLDAWVARKIAREASLPAERVRVFAEVADRLAQAQEAAARLEWARALRTLAVGLRLVEAHADVSGAALWLAELETRVGIVAAQARRLTLSEDAFARAATLDPSRGVRAGEAAPEVVERATTIFRSVATRPTGSFEVRANAPNARLFVDDQEVGRTPGVVRVPVGRHVLRIEAAGFKPYGRVLDVLEGRRPPLNVTLAPDEYVVALDRIRRSTVTLDGDAIGAALEELSLSELWVLEVGRGEQSRALFSICGQSGCVSPERLEAGDRLRTDGAPHADVRSAVRSGRRWLDEEERIIPEPPPPPIWERWWFWTLVGSAVVASGIAIGVAARPEPDEQRRFVVDPGDLGTIPME